MYFTHIGRSDVGRRGRTTPHMWTDVIFDDMAPTYRIEMRRNYRLMREAGLSTWQVRRILWSTATAGITEGRMADHDVWRVA